MDLDAAFEFSRYASRLRTGQPELAAQVLRAIDRPASIDTGDLGADGAAPDAAALAAALRAIYRQRMVESLSPPMRVLAWCGAPHRVRDVAMRRRTASC